MSNEEQRRNTTHSNLTLAELINQVPLVRNNLSIFFLKNSISYHTVHAS